MTEDTTLAAGRLRGVAWAALLTLALSLALPAAAATPAALDSDGDGLIDGLEDRDHDGVLDPGETDPQATDTDGDGLLDGEEDADLDGQRDPGETDPTAFDSDSDGVPDGWEPFPFCDIDGDRLPNALDPDSDGDGLGDLDELRWGADPLVSDTDGDCLTDGEEARAGTNPCSPDSDGDGINDIDEAPHSYAPPGVARASYWVQAAAPGPTAVYDSPAGGPWVAGPDASGVIYSARPFPTLAPGAYRLLFDARCASSPSGSPTLTLRLEGPAAPFEATYSLRWAATRATLAPAVPATPPPVKPSIPPSPQPAGVPNPYRWYCTPRLELPEGGTLAVTASCPPGEDVRLDRLLLVHAEDAFTPVTDPLNPDTDRDGVRDGDEGPAPSWWWEAEAFVPGAAGFAHAVPDPWASNGFLAAPGPDGVLCRIEGLTVIPPGPYCVLLRGRPAALDSAAARVRVTMRVQPLGPAPERLIEGAAELQGGHPQGRWVAADLGGAEGTLNLVLDAPARLSLVVSDSGASPGVSGAATGAAPPPATAASGPLLDQVALVRGHLDPARSGCRLPNRATNPLDPDSDGDGVRPDLPGPLAGLAVLLSDGQELKLGTHSLDCDTDGDHEGAAPEGWGAQDAAPGTDALDPDPWTPAGGDSPGTPPPARPGGGPQPHPSDPRRTDSDRDGLPDATEDWDGDGVWEAGETDPLEPDTDGDALLDGTYWPVGAEKLVYEPARPDQRAAFESLLARLEPPTDPRPGSPPVRTYVDRDPGQVAFLGEGDINVRGRYRAWYSTSGLWQPARPLGVDSDQDGLADGLEALGLGTNPLCADTDHDLLPDLLEILGTDTNPCSTDYPDLEVDPAGLDYSPQRAVAAPGGNWLELYATVRNLGPLDAPGFHRVQFYLAAEGAAPQPCGLVRLPAIEAGGARRVRMRVLMLPAAELAALSGEGRRPPCFAVAPGRYHLEVALSTPVNQDGRTQNDRASSELVVEAAPEGAGAVGAEAGPPSPPRAAAPADTDSDGLPDGDEATVGSDPRCRDSDGDGVPDGEDLDPLHRFEVKPVVEKAAAEAPVQPVAPGQAPATEPAAAGAGSTAGPAPHGWSRSFGPGFLRLPATVEAYGLEGRILEPDLLPGRLPQPASPPGDALASSPRSHQAAQAALAPPGFEVASCAFVDSRAGPTFTWPEAGPRVEYRTWLRQYRVELANREPMGCGGFWSALARVGVAGGREQELWLQFTLDPAWDRTLPPQPTDGVYRLPAVHWRAFAERAVRSGAGPDWDGSITQPPLASGLAPAVSPAGVSACLARIPLPARVAPGDARAAGSVWLELVPVWLVRVAAPTQPAPGTVDLDPGEWAPGAGPRLEPLDPRALRFSAALRCIVLEQHSDGSRRELRVGSTSLEDLGTPPPLDEALALTGAGGGAAPTPCREARLTLPTGGGGAGGGRSRAVTVLARRLGRAGRPGSPPQAEVLDFVVRGPAGVPPAAGTGLDPAALASLEAALALSRASPPDRDPWQEECLRQGAAAGLLGHWPAWGPGLLAIAQRAAGAPASHEAPPPLPPLFTYRRLHPSDRLQPVYGLDWLGPAPRASDGGAGEGGAEGDDAKGGRPDGLLLWTAQARAWARALRLVNARLAAGEPACLVLPQARPPTGTPRSLR